MDRSFQMMKTLKYGTSDISSSNHDKSDQSKKDNVINVLSYNISFASQLQQEIGSEKDFVARCKQLERNCFDHLIEQLKYLNTIPDVAPSVIGIQEAEHPDLVNKLLDALPQLKAFHRAGVWNNSVQKYVGALLMWDPDVLGSKKYACALNLDDGEDGRVCGIVTTEKNVTLIVAHFPWIVTKTDLEKIQAKISQFVFNPQNIIIMADTNDANTLIHYDAPLVIKGKRLSQNRSRAWLQHNLKTCCWHDENSNYGHFTDTGDYILAENVEYLHVPIKVPDNKTSTLLYSDHLPVCAKVHISL
jgi:endonuclease/exonuclease/phosphatase family metal-dependent hydrolase